MEKDLEEKLSMYKDTLFGHYCKITNNKNSINNYDEYKKYLRDSLNVSLRILIGNDRIHTARDIFEDSINKIIELEGENFFEGRKNAIKVSKSEIYEYILETDFIDDTVKASIVC